MDRHPGAVATTASAQRLKSIQDAAWLLLVILAPLWVNLWGQQPFELSKVMLARTLIWLLAGLAATEYLLTRTSLRRAWKPNPLAAPVGALALAVVTTTLTGVDWRLSLWGSYERSQGAVTLLSYLLLFFLAADQLRAVARARQVATAMAAAGAPLVLMSLLQVVGWNPFGLISDARSPIYATLGRANFVGAYLALLAPVTLGLLLTTPHRGWRRAWSALFLAELVVIGLTLARSAWLAAAVSMSLFTLLWWGSSLSRRWRTLAWGGLSLLFVSGPLAVMWLGQGRLGSAAARLTIWQSTLALIRQRPLLGLGPDALGLAFPRVFAPELVYYQGRQFFVDRAHNWLLDWAVTAGVLGLLALVLAFILFVIVVGRALRRPDPPEQQALLTATLAAVFGNAAGNLVSFDVTPTALASWLLMGLGVALAAPPPASGDAGLGPQPLRRWALIGLLFLGIGAAIWQVNGRPLMADIAARAANRSAQTGDLVGATALAERAVRAWPLEPAHHLLLGQTYWQRAVSEPAAAPSWLPKAEAALLAARQLRPGEVAVWLRLAQFYAAAARQLGADTRALADQAYQQAIALAPNHATIYTAWGRTRLEDGNPEGAAPLLRQAVRLDASSGEAYLYLAAAELALGRLEVALADYQEAVRLLPEFSQAHTGLAQAYWLLGRRQEALSAVEAALRLDPDNALALSLRREIEGTQ